MRLSRDHIEELASAVIWHYYDRFPVDENDREKTMMQETPIEKIAGDLLGLRVRYEHLSDCDKICGVTAYADTNFEADTGKTIRMKAGDILIEWDLFDTEYSVRHLGRRRFTLAHECAHQILFSIETDDRKDLCRTNYRIDRAYSLRELKSREDWNEWHANALGAAVLMPRDHIELAMWRLADSRKLRCYGYMFDPPNLHVLTTLCRIYRVSRSAAVIRLRQLGYIEDRPAEEYVSPYDVVYAE